MPSSAAAALAAASDTPRIALAPSRDLFGVPSSSTSARSRPAWSSASRPPIASAISPLTLPTAFVTPLPLHSRPPSRSSVASNSPVEAPDGTAARPCVPERSSTSTSTVGFPRLSRICRACTRSIWLIGSRSSPGSVSVALGHADTGVVVELLVGLELVPVLAVAAGERRGALDATAEAVGGGAQRQLGVDLGLAGHVDGGEQQIADLVEEPVAAVGAGDLVGLVTDGLERPLEAGEVEAARGGAALDLAGVERPRQVLGDLAEDARLAARFVALDAVPVG